MIPVGNRPAWDDFETLQKRLCLLAVMRLDDTGDDIRACGLFCPGRDQHFIGLADPRRGTEKNFQAALFDFLRFSQESVGRRAPFGVIACLHAPRYSCSAAAV
jgi:hypothetical protein